MAERLETLQVTGERQDEDIAALAPWFHNLHLPDGRQTAPDHPLGDFPAFKWAQVADSIPADLEGWRVLDIGCNAGFYSFELAKRGARVLGIDHDEHYLEQARWAAERFGLAERTEFRRMGVYELAREQASFDLILFMGVFYHLRYPLLALDLVARRVKRLMVFQSLSMPGTEVLEHTGGEGLDERDSMIRPGWPKMAFIEHTLAGDPTNWWAPNRAAAMAMLRSAGLRILREPGEETFVCEPDPHRDPLDGEIISAMLDEVRRGFCA
jgi:tRNA (mo5U34)-methyltransferase